MTRTSPPSRYESLDSLRGLCALGIAVLHLWATNGFTGSRVHTNLYLLVDFFFVLSGFVIAANYEHRLGTWAEARAFAVLRLGRLYPLHLATLAGLLALELVAAWRYPLLLWHRPFTGDHSPAAFLANLLMLQGFGPMTWNAPAWSIGVELWTYLLFAACCVTLAPARRWLLMAAAAGMLIALQAVTYGDLPPGVHNLSRCVAGFFAGALTFRLLHARPVHAAGWQQAAALGAAVLLLLTPKGWAHAAAPLFMAAVVAAFSSDRGNLARVLRARPLLALGRWSYSIYMLHWPVAMALLIGTNFARDHLGLNLWGELIVGGERTQSYGRNAAQGWLILLAFLLATIATSALTYRWIEEPGRRWARRLAARGGTAAPARSGSSPAAQEP